MPGTTRQRPSVLQRNMIMRLQPAWYALARPIEYCNRLHCVHRIAFMMQNEVQDITNSKGLCARLWSILGLWTVWQAVVLLHITTPSSCLREFGVLEELDATLCLWSACDRTVTA